MTGRPILRPRKRLQSPVRCGALVALAALACCRSEPKPAVAPGRETSAVMPNQPRRAASSAEVAAVDRARALKEEGRDEEALALLARAIETNPTLTVAHMEMGEIYKEKRDYRSAERAFARAADAEPSNFDAQYNHGLMLQLLERFAESIRAYLRALAIRPDDPQANLNLATAYLQIHEAGQALPYAQRAVALARDSGPAYANLGSVLSALGRYEEAVRAYESAAELMELTPALLLNMAEGYGKTERFEQMNNTLAALLASAPSAAGHERQGFALFKLRRYAEAERSFRSALALDDRYYPALNGLGVCLLNQYINSNKEDQAARAEAIELFRKSLRINRSQPRILELLSRFS